MSGEDNKTKLLPIFDYIAYILVFSLVEIVFYKLFVRFNIEKYWILIPIIMILIISCFLHISNYKKYKLKFKGTVFLCAHVLTYLLVACKINIFVMKYFDVFSSIIFVVVLINIILKSIVDKEEESTEDGDKSKLFNLFYINTSKVHEIVMLIDNKIMKTVEREQVSEELLKYNASLSIGSQDKWGTETGYVKEDSTKKRVYENFDVKTTKSIMLRKIYDTTQKNKSSHSKLNLGDLTIFENIMLEQRNIDDTVIILNVLQDSKIKNELNESLEVNLNKMMDRMLDDFTIDYIFSSDKQNGENDYIIQLPYKSNENFENGYQHNDLQLGKLSLIGIYRGEIDFSKKDSTSSKFLELISGSYNNKSEQTSDLLMKSSNPTIKQPDMPIKFSHKKLEKKLHLIDVIAIIQELNIDRKE